MQLLRRTFIVLATSLLPLVGCLQGGQEPLEGVWETPDWATGDCHCYIMTAFGPLGQAEVGTFEIKQYSPTILQDDYGWYSMDATTLHIKSRDGDFKDFDMRWVMGDVPGWLMLENIGGQPVFLKRVEP